MNLVKLQFKKSSTDGYIYCYVVEQNTNFDEFIHNSHPSIGAVIKGDAVYALKCLIMHVGSNNMTISDVVVTRRAKPVCLSNDDLTNFIKIIIEYSIYEISTTLATVTVCITEGKAPQTFSEAYSEQYNKAYLLSLIKNLRPSRVTSTMTPTPDTQVFRCRGCDKSFSDKTAITETATSCDGKIALCNYCKSTTKCESCGFNEPKLLIVTGLSISEESGKDQKFPLCRKCARDKYQYHTCHCVYDANEYEQCPCSIRKDFKDYISAHNADVLTTYQMDSYCDELFGIEIETGTPNRNRKKFKEIAEITHKLVEGDAILKYDSSIDYINKAEGIDNDFKGFEIVTRPMTFKNTTRFLREFCKSRHPLLRSWEVATCGLHIHVSKACLQPFEIGKILLFINDKRNRNFIKMIAKREDKRFAKFMTKKILDYRNNNPSCHYEAINTSKPHTIEFRIFRGTLNLRTIVSYLQFVQSVIDFVRVTEKEKLHYKQYVEWIMLKTERSRFRELKERLKSEKLTEIREDGEI